MGRKRSFFYTDKQNALIEKAAFSKKPSKVAKSLAKQFKRPVGGIMVKIYKIRAFKKANNASANKTEYAVRKEKFVTLAKNTSLNFTNVKKAEMYDNHIRIYF